MTVDRAELRRLADEATAGPWVADAEGDCVEGDGVLVAAVVRMDRTDARFIAAARSAVPALLDENDRRDQLLARATDALVTLTSWAECVGGEECEQPATACGGCAARDAAAVVLADLRAAADGRNQQ